MKKDHIILGYKTIIRQHLSQFAGNQSYTPPHKTLVYNMLDNREGVTIYATKL